MPYKTETIEPGTELLTVNMGPSHPSTHGVLRLILTLDGERVVKAEPVMGYLHRGMEKIAENKTYTQFIPYTDRLDYLAPLSNNVAFALAVEKLVGTRVPPRCEHIRVLACELSRISAHLLWLGTHAVDLGAISVFMYTFREREVLYDFFEALTGTRLTTSYTRIGGLSRDLPSGFLDQVGRWLERFPRDLDEYEKLLTKNTIWVERTKGVGVLKLQDAVDLGVTGANLRASGLEWDLRKARPYSGYEQFDFEVAVGTVGDVYDRYLVRIEEMRQAVRICRQAIETMPGGPICVDDPKLVLPPKEKVLTSMEELIHQFIIVTEGFDAPKGEVYHAIEAPKGELGFYIVSDGGPSPHRMKIRSPSFVNLQALPPICEGALISDVVAIIASLDPVMGEVDR
ncbi:MAG TPA: NADH dehydrogenase (quinone) subunit D [Candidatus Polarisedimenticolia bacterium]|nr:NADH dehydrogenase (quinone) subunit D [Candidatus Polarisedimenticolia bacterium]